MPCHVPTLIRGTASGLRPLRKLVTFRHTRGGTGLKETAINKRNGEVQEISNVKGASGREREKRADGKTDPY
jgi:hypothetical protein